MQPASQPQPTATVLRFAKPRRKPAAKQGEFQRRRAEVELRARMAL